jgi:hypothetical protein
MNEDKDTKTQADQPSAVQVGLLAAILVGAANLVGGLSSEILPIDRTWCSFGLLLIGLALYNVKTAKNAQERIRAFILMAVGFGAGIVGFFVRPT